MRMFTAVPMHFFFGIIQGYFVGLARYESSKRYLPTALLLALLSHAVYDFGIFFIKSTEATVIYSLAFGTSAIIFSILAVEKLLLKSMRIAKRNHIPIETN